MRVRRFVTAVVLGVGCGPSASTEPEPELPDDTGVWRDTGPGFVPVDTGAEDLDETPVHTLTIREWGDVTVSPAGGPYTTLTGRLQVRELLDGVAIDTGDTAERVTLPCDLEFALAGVPSERACPGCELVFDVQFSLLTGDRTGCHDPFLPMHASTWALAWHPVRSVLLRDFGDSGTWLVWFEGTRDADVVTFAWETTVGVAMDDEEMDP